MRKTSAQGLAALFSLVVVNLFTNRIIRIVLLSLLAIGVIVHSRVTNAEEKGDKKLFSELKKEVSRRRSSAGLDTRKKS